MFTAKAAREKSFRQKERLENEFIEETFDRIRTSASSGYLFATIGEPHPVCNREMCMEVFRENGFRITKGRWGCETKVSWDKEND